MVLSLTLTLSAGLLLWWVLQTAVGYTGTVTLLILQTHKLTMTFISVSLLVLFPKRERFSMSDLVAGSIASALERRGMASGSLPFFQAFCSVYSAYL